MKKGFKIILWVVIVAVLVGSGIYMSTRPLRAELLEIYPRAIEDMFTESGIVSAAWQRNLFSITGGKVLNLYVSEGDVVAAGDILLRLDTSDITYQIAALQGELSSLRGQERQVLSGSRETETENLQPIIDINNKLLAAREDFERAEALYLAGVLNEADLVLTERAIRELELLLLQQEELLEGAKEQFSGAESALRSQIALLEYQRENAVFVAPEAAVAASVNVKEGDVVSAGLPLITLIKPEVYEVEVYLLAEDVLHVQTGMDVRVAFKGQSGDEEFVGEVTKISLAAVERFSSLGLAEQRVKVTIGLKGDVSGLRSGYAMDVTFVTRREENRFVLPKTVIFTYEGESAIWVAEQGRAVIRRVEKGLETDDETVITSGLTEGDLVIRNIRMEGLKAGVRITPAN